MEPLRQKDTDKQPILQVDIYLSESKCQYPHVVTLWVEPEAPGDVVLPLEPGLGLSHLLLDPVQEEGVHETLGVALHGGQPEVL